MQFTIHATEIFEKRFYKIIPKDKQEDIKDRINKLVYNPFAGKPLGDRYLRELKLGKFRIFYEIYEKEIIILMLNISDKRHQQETIDVINIHRLELRKFIKNLKENDKP